MSEGEETISEDEIETEDSVADEAPSPELSEDAATIEQLQLERDTYLSDLQRIQAEFDNFRRQAQKRQSDLTERC